MSTFSATAAAAELLDLVESFEMQALTDRFAPEGVLDLPNRPGGFPTRLVGHTDIGRFLRTLPKALERITFVERTYHQTIEPRRVIVEYRGEGTARTGKPYNNRYIGVFEFDETGAVQLWREYFDPLVLIEAVTPISGSSA